MSARGVVVSGPFVVAPAWWRGGGGVRGGAWCRARVPGLHAAALRVLSSTATVRHLHVLADSLLFTPEHISIIVRIFTFYSSLSVFIYNIITRVGKSGIAIFIVMTSVPGCLILLRLASVLCHSMIP